MRVRVDGMALRAVLVAMLVMVSATGAAAAGQDSGPVSHLHIGLCLAASSSPYSTAGSKTQHHLPLPTGGPADIVFQGLDMWTAPLAKTIELWWAHVEVAADDDVAAQFSVQEASTWSKWLNPQASRRVLSPFETAHLHVSTSSPGTFSCRVTYAWRYPIMFVLGLLLVMNCKALSRSVAVYYTAGVSMGTLMAALALLIVVLLQLKGNRAAQLLVIVGAAAGGLTSAMFGAVGPLLQFLTTHWQFTAGYLLISAVLMLAYLYWKGPPTNPRTFHLVQIVIFFLGLACMGASTSFNLGRLVALASGLVLPLLFALASCCCSRCGCARLFSCCCCSCRRAKYRPNYMNQQQMEIERRQQSAKEFAAMSQKLHAAMPVDQDTALEMVKKFWPATPSKARRRGGDSTPRFGHDGGLLDPDDVSDIDDDDWACFQHEDSDRDE